MASSGYPRDFTTATLALALAAVSASAAIFFYIRREKWEDTEAKASELQKSLDSALEKCAAERQGRVRAQQALRKALAEPVSGSSESTCYPMRPIGVVQSCFSTRNGTPRQPLLVPLARACLIFNPAMVPPASLEGLGEYSHCWIIYVFHLNTDLEKLWKQPSKTKFKAKVRVPRLKGGKMGVFATRSPHRPCPIGLTVAKVEAIQGHMVLLSGVDLVDGTVDHMLAVASVTFTEGFFVSLADCWEIAGKRSMYASQNEFQSLLKQVLSWDIRSLSQRNRPHNTLTKIRNINGSTLSNNSLDLDEHSDDESLDHEPGLSLRSEDIVYHLIIEGLDVSYRIDCNGNVIVEKVLFSPEIPNGNRNHCSYLTWEGKLR